MLVPMPTHPHGDPRLKVKGWVMLRNYWRARGLPCARCGDPIDYKDRTKGPSSLVVGHIVGRDEGGDDTIDNTQPECALCSSKSGNLYRRVKEGRAIQRPIQTKEW